MFTIKFVSFVEWQFKIYSNLSEFYALYETGILQYILVGTIWSCPGSLRHQAIITHGIAFNTQEKRALSSTSNGIVCPLHRSDEEG